MKTISELKKGDYFKLYDSNRASVWVRGEYVREKFLFSCHRFDDINHEKLLRGDREVFIDFEF